MTTEPEGGAGPRPCVRVSRPLESVALLTLDRPERLNALTFAMFDELESAVDATARDEGVRVIVLTGSGRGFCAGLDLDDVASLGSMDLAENLLGQEGWARAITRVHEIATPVVAAVNGPAAGAGFALALAADVRVASTAARFNAAFVRVGLSGGDCGTSYLLPRLVGAGRAAELLLTGRIVEAEEAFRIGLVERLVEPDALLDEALALASQILANSPIGVRLTKQLLRVNVDAPSLASALELENRSQVLAARTDDHRQALEAFRARRALRGRDA
jgi:enoyl-CoA hydratase/carnithine racemase